MSEQVGDGPNRFEFGLLLIANVLPLLGHALFGWGYRTVVQLYCIDVVALLAVYGGCAMFAKRRSLVDEREQTLLPTFGGGESDETPRTITLRRSLPPVYLRNLRVVVPTVLFCVSIVFALGVVATVPADETASGWPAARIGPFISAFSAFASPLRFGAALAIVAAHLLTVPRSYFRRRRYEEMSAYVTLELPVRFVLVYAGLAALCFSALVLVLAVTGLILPKWTGVVPVLVALSTKFALDWNRLRAERTTNPDGIATWFVPTDPPARDRSD